MSIEERNHAENPSDGNKEKLSTFVRDGAIKLPPGFRFQPTDQEIVFQYLVRKVFSCPLPTSVIPEIVNICNFNPWDLPGEWEQERYFFSKKEAKYGHGNRVNRKSSDGYWKATGLDKHITRCCNNNSIARKKDMITGMKKTLVFYKGKPSTTRTHWIMHEYRLVHSTSSPSTTSNDKKSWIQLGNWVLCHVLLNKRSRKSVEDDNYNRSDSLDQLTNQNFMNNITVPIDCDMESSSCSSSSSCGSSVVTQEVSSSRKPIDCEETKN
ncbi:NAC domain-containing protein [Artemisia annua]|uniref:NAC domain-containing protein n=1 Tax=Artemisia annua TaxID=35608 RepID=A0A2U1KT48_ARTAN|nr:NAC domain-containing protein [Artemisia annua]